MKDVYAHGRNISGSNLGQWQDIHLKNRNESSNQKPGQLHWNEIIVNLYALIILFGITMFSP